jgi:O-acetyl-ADP-ribose deacetylase (regulator of RNase III)
MEIATEHGLASLAFPSISTGIYGYPIEQAARIAIATVREFQAAHPSAPDVVFCCFSRGDLKVYEDELSADQRTNHD